MDDLFGGPGTSRIGEAVLNHDLESYDLEFLIGIAVTELAAFCFVQFLHVALFCVELMLILSMALWIATRIARVGRILAGLRTSVRVWL
jgi:hypothetical protein